MWIKAKYYPLPNSIFLTSWLVFLKLYLIIILYWISLIKICAHLFSLACKLSYYILNFVSCPKNLNVYHLALYVKSLLILDLQQRDHEIFTIILWMNHRLFIGAQVSLQIVWRNKEKYPFQNESVIT